MKITALAALAMSMFAASSAMAATEMSVNGFVNSMNTTVGNTTSTSSTAEVLGSFGYYFSPQLVGRIVVNEYANSTPNTTTGQMAIGGGLKYYFTSPAKGSTVFYGFGDLSLLSVTSTSTFNGSSTTSTGTGTLFDAGVGVAQFITETVSFDLDVKAVSDSYTIDSFSFSDSGVQFDFGITARF